MNTSLVNQNSIIWEGYRYRLDATLKTGDISWRCAKTKPPGKARIRTGAACSSIISQKKKQSRPLEKSNEAKSKSIYRKELSNLCPGKRRGHTGYSLKRVFFPFRSNVHHFVAQTSVFPHICPLNPLKRPSPGKTH